MYFFDDLTTEIRDTNTDKPTKTQKTTWNCELMNKATNPQFAEFPTQAVEALKKVYTGLKYATELQGQDFLTYQQVDLQKIANGDTSEAKKLGPQAQNLINIFQDILEHYIHSNTAPINHYNNIFNIFRLRHSF